MSRRRVWVVDDSPLEADRVRRALSDAFEIEVFLDGATLVEQLAHRGAPDVIVLDWLMPGVSGIEVCKFVRSSPAPLRHLGILLLTAMTRTDHIVEGLSAGANDFLCKPFADEELVARVSALARASGLVEEAALAGRTRRLLESAPDPLIAVDAAGRLEYANPEACRALGRPLEALAGQRLSAVLPELPLAAMTRDEAPAAAPDLRLGGRVFAPAVRVRAADATSSTMIALRDVTDRRRDDDRRLDLYTVIAHDLRAPLSAIAMRVELMRCGKHGALPPSLLQDAERIDGSIRSLVTMLDDFLALARLEGAGYRLERKDVDLVTLVDGVLEEVEPLLEAGGLESRREVEDPAAERVRVRADWRRISQVVSNLVGNAIKFTPPGGTITTRVEARPGHVQVTVTDTGIGVPADALPGLWNRYARGRQTEHDVQGTGLGLMIVREVIQAHGGAVGAESEPGRGSSFWFRLPTETSADGPPGAEGAT